MATYKWKKVSLSTGALAWVAVLSIAGLAALHMGSSPVSADNSKEIKIGVVSLQTVLENYSRWRAFDSAWVAKKKEIIQALLAVEKEITDKTRELKHTLSTTARAGQLYREITLLGQRWEFDKDYLLKEHDKAGERVQREIFDEIEAEIKSYASEKGYTAVFMSQQLPKKLREMVEMRAYFQDLLYYDKSIDISDDIVKRLNAAAGEPAGEKKKEE